MEKNTHQQLQECFSMSQLWFTNNCFQIQFISVLRFVRHTLFSFKVNKPWNNNNSNEIASEFINASFINESAPAPLEFLKLSIFLPKIYTDVRSFNFISNL